MTDEIQDQRVDAVVETADRDGRDAAEPATDTTERPDAEAAETTERADAEATETAEHNGVRAEAGEQRVNLAEALAAAERERDEYLDHLRRERADFENFRRRTTRERMDALDRGAQALVANLLGVLDNFGFVLKAAEESTDGQLAKGTHMVHSELMRALREAGLEEVPGVGAPFDPTWHEAMMQVEADGDVEHPTVVEVLRPGYRFKGRVLRPASVSVAQ